jgi:hypothetical protein
MSRIKTTIISALFVLLIIFMFIWFLVTQPIFFNEKIDLDISVEPAQLEKHVKVLSEKYIPRDYKNPENLDSVASYIEKEFLKTRGLVKIQTYNIDSTVYKNVVVQLGPQSAERLVIGSHYDAYKEFPGADDNASGLAGLIELAKLLNKVKLPIMVELVAYTLEEPPFFRTDSMGSALHALSLKSKNIPIRLMIALEMIGYFSDAEGSQKFPLDLLSLFYPTEGNWIAVIGDLSSMSAVRSVKIPMASATDLPVYSFNAPPEFIPGIDWSDHLNYWKHDYPAVMVTNTAYLRNLKYHTPDDTADRLDYEKMAMVVKGVFAAVINIAQEYN